MRCTPRQTHNPIATAVILDLFDGYANGLSPRTDLERHVHHRLGQVDADRRVSQRIVHNFRSRPAEATVPVFGAFESGLASSVDSNELRDVFAVPPPTFLLDDDVSLGDPPVFPSDTRFTLSYTGLYCRQRTGDRFFAPSDEPYIITSVVDIVDGDNVVRTELHPVGDPDMRYGDVDSGEHRNGPIAACWSGGAPSLELSLVAVVMEHDEGDQEHYRDEIDKVVNAAAAIAAYYNVALGALIKLFAADIILWIISSDDEEIGTDVQMISPDWVSRWSVIPTKNYTGTRLVPQASGFLKFEMVEVTDETDLPYHIATHHDHDGEYVATFRFDADQEPISVPESLSEFNHGDSRFVAHIR